MQAPPRGVILERTPGGVEVKLDRAPRFRRAAGLAGTCGMAFVLAFVATAMDAHAPKEVGFILATVLAAATVGFARAAVHARRPTRIVLDADALEVENPRPWSRENVRLLRAEVDAVEQTATGIAARVRGGDIALLARDLTADQATFLEGVLAGELGQP